MVSIAENLRATLLSLKQISDRVKSLILTSVTKSEATADTNSILTALNNAKTALQGGDTTATLTAIEAAIAAIPTGLATEANATANKNAIIAAMPSVTGYATESNATSNKNAIIQKIEDNAGIPTETIPSTTSSQELAPNTLYIFASRSSALTLTLGTPITGIANEYHCFIICDDTTAPTITWPTGITWNGGSAPTIAAAKTYEVSILNDVAAYFETDNPVEESESV